MQPLHRPFRNSVARALAGSLMLHALLAVALWQLPGTPAAVPVPEQFVPITLRTVPELPEPRPQPEPIAEAPPKPAAEPERQQAAADIDVEPQRSQATQDAAQIGAAPDPEATPEETEQPFERAPLVAPEVDFEATHREAIAYVVESLRAAAAAHTFSLRDLPGTGDTGLTDPDGDGSDLDVFERAAQLKSDGVLPVGRARTRLGRVITDLCNQLTGGFSIFGMVDVCSEPAARADLFGHLRPEYMESVPLCTSEEDLELQVEQTGTGAIGALKCVLVPRAVREEFYRRFDPALAGWLPAEDAPTQAPGDQSGSNDLGN
jgi:hypothetical protein